MNYKLFNVSVPVKDNNVVLVDGLVQHDTANIVNVRLMDGVEPFDFTGYVQLFLEILKPDGKVIEASVGANPADDIVLPAEDSGYEVDEEILNKNNNPYTIQVIESKEGLVRFTLKDQATVLEGTHFCQLLIMGGGERLTTARINYYVGETMYGEAPDLVSSNEYSSLVELYRQLVALISAELARADAEAGRMSAEDAREVQFRQLFNEITEHINASADAVTTINEYRALIQEMYDFIMQTSPSSELIDEIITKRGLVDQTALDNIINSVDAKIRHFDAGSYTDDEDDVKHLQARRGNDADLPELMSGEFGFSEDTHTAYIGGSNGNIPLNGTYAAGPDAPARTDILWIDTGAGGVIKYFDGDTWQPAMTAVFA